jgi:hypothetical protein
MPKEFLQFNRSFVGLRCLEEYAGKGNVYLPAVPGRFPWLFAGLREPCRSFETEVQVAEFIQAIWLPG